MESLTETVTEKNRQSSIDENLLFEERFDIYFIAIILLKKVYVEKIFGGFWLSNANLALWIVHMPILRFFTVSKWMHKIDHFWNLF